MSYKQRLKAALNHKQPDQIPVDFGGTGQTCIHVKCVAKLREYYGLNQQPVKVTEPYQMLGEIEDDLKEVLGVDTDSISTGGTMFGFRNENWKEWRAPWGQELLVPGNFNTILDENDDVFIYPQGDTSVPASGKMPKTSFFFDATNRQAPIDESQLDWHDNTEEFSHFSDSELEKWKEVVQNNKENPRALVGNVVAAGFGDIALVPAVSLKHPKGIRDVAEWYMSTMMRPDYIHNVFEKQCEIAIANLEKAAPVIGDMIQVVYSSGTDFGTQSSTFCSKETYCALWLPYYKRVNDWIHQHTSWKTFMHCCGAVKSFIPSFIESGFDILNPVQCSAIGMNPQELKDTFGKEITFWGGGVNTQQTLPFGTPDQVREEVLSRCEIFAKDGGFVFSSIHNVQANTPVENIVAMIDAVKAFNT